MLDFAPFAAARGEPERAAKWRGHAAALRAALEHSGWDGDWYRRAYFDDGTPLGSAAQLECRIDSIAQSWAVISGAAEPERAERAMAAVTAQLVRPDLTGSTHQAYCALSIGISSAYALRHKLREGRE